MAEFKRLDEAAFRKTAVRGKRAAVPRATAVRFDKRSHRVTVRLDNGIDFSFDTREAHGLRDAARDDLVGVTVEGLGSTIHFPRLDADFSVGRLLEGFLGPLDWAKRQARSTASRENGKRGGRPPRAAAEPA